MSSKLIYVVDDEANIRGIIKQYLVSEGYRVESFENGQLALDAFNQKQADMLIVDIMMPIMDGLTLCKEIRSVSNVPIIMVSAKDEEIDKIVGLEIGGDDYISKPFSPREMVSRVKTIFRRVDNISFIPNDGKPKSNIVQIKDVTIYLDERKALCDEKEIAFTGKEYTLFLFLAENKNKVYNREQLIANVWGYDFYGDTRAVDDLVKRVRKKLALLDAKVEVETVWGYGYKISD